MRAILKRRNPAGGRGFERWQTLAWTAWWSFYIIAASMFAGVAIGSLIVALVARWQS
jgi:hypothetical protein